MLQNVILNEAETMKTWSGFITESTGVTDRSKLTWMTKYCAYHDMHEKQELCMIDYQNISEWATMLVGRL